MSKTRVEIQFKVVAILKGGIVGDAPSAEDAACVDGFIDGQRDELERDGTIYIDDVNALDDALFNSFCALVANAAADDFGGVSDERKGQMIRNRMRVIVRQTPGYGPASVEFF
jgi:hypothetical protein